MVMMLVAGFTPVTPLVVIPPVLIALIAGNNLIGGGRSYGRSAARPVGPGPAPRSSGGPSGPRPAEPVPAAGGRGARRAPMTLFRDRGMVLRTIRLGEADRIVTLMTEEHGKVRAVAKGVRRTTSKFGSRLEPLSHVALLGWQGRGDLDTINQVEVIDTNRAVREDLDRMAAAMSMLEVVDQIGQERHGNPRLYEMLVGAIAALAQQRSPMVSPAFFLKVLALEGSAPVLDGCVSCGEEDEDQLVAFDIVEGGVLCRSCRRGRPLSPAGLSSSDAPSGVACPACWPSPARRSPMRSPRWPPRPWRPTSTADSARCARARCPDVAGGAAGGGTTGRSTVLWFRRDLRTADHPALLAAVEEASSAAGSVAPLFVVDDALVASAGANRRSFLSGTLDRTRRSARRVPGPAGRSARGGGAGLRRRGGGPHRVRHR